MHVCLKVSISQASGRKDELKILPHTSRSSCVAKRESSIGLKESPARAVRGNVAEGSGWVVAVTQADHDEDSLITALDNDELENERQSSHGATLPNPHAQVGHSVQSFSSGRQDSSL
ncbi:hypothetical protein E2C01_082260 [Portunus trituberculatus]|uniref:Uncharacterized protein n=1 Tax=Portunus trituberculatus TaxID=210409 RepID=A0A5B7IYL2_PORTR|nr:hypothetical protein [Portunus trituberculatus]